MTANINPETGIAYGYIAANALDSELVNELMDNGTNQTAVDAYADWLQEKAAAAYEAGEYDSEEDAREDIDGCGDEFWEAYEDCEPHVHGMRDGVTYVSSWLGGALNFFIIESPHVTDCARLASPCVPNAGILDTLDGHVTSYDVPADWRSARQD